MWNQKFGCLQHAGHTPVPLHNSQSAMALLHGYPLGLFDHRSGPARYVPDRRLDMFFKGYRPKNGLRVRAMTTDGLQNVRGQGALTRKPKAYFSFYF